MFLFKRNGYYHLEYFDEVENRPKRISTKCKIKQDALKFVTNFMDELKAKNKVKFITLKQFKIEYLAFVNSTLSKGYYKNVEFSFKLLTEKFWDDAVLTTPYKINIPRNKKFTAKDILMLHSN